MELEIARAFLLDANSISALAYHYVPFDANKKLRTFIEGCFKQGTIVLIEEVWQEIKGVKEITKALPFLSGKKVPAKTGPHSVKRAKEKWFNPKACRGMDREKFESQASQYTKTADFRLIALCWEQKQPKPGELVTVSEKPFTIVTEESIKPDKKTFMKIPLICEKEKIECIKLFEMLQRLGVDVEFKLPPQ